MGAFRHMLYLPPGIPSSCVRDCCDASAVLLRLDDGDRPIGLRRHDQTTSSVRLTRLACFRVNAQTWRRQPSKRSGPGGALSFAVSGVGDCCSLPRRARRKARPEGTASFSHFSRPRLLREVTPEVSFTLEIRSPSIFLALNRVVLCLRS